jgi:hypothetical protein
MILRVVRAAVVPGREEELSDAFRMVVSAALPEIPGLLRGTFGRHMHDSGERVILTTLWTDWASLRAAIGDDWQRPHFFAALQDLIEDVDVEHYEVGAEYAEGEGVTLPVSPPAKLAEAASA